VVIARELHSMNHIDDVGAADDSCWVFVDHPVPDLAGGVIALIVWGDQFATQTGFEVLHDRWA
jgi:hypothetical protein